MSDTAGFYGKIPSVGDFIHRRLPADFITAWDGWLQQTIVASRESLADTWLDHYLAAPFWRFGLAPGVAGPQAWVGVLMPSVDRVGRYFPFTVAVPVPGHADPAETFLEAENWFRSVETLAAEALGHELDLAAWDQRLAALPTPLAVPAELSDDATIPLVGRRGGPQAFSLAAGPAGRFAVTGATSLFRRPYSLFSGRGRGREGRMLLTMEGLPDGQRACALLDCAWAEHGWQVPGRPAVPAEAVPTPVPAAVPAAAPLPPVEMQPAPAAAAAPLGTGAGLMDLLPPSGAPDLCAILSAPSSDAPALMTEGLMADLPPAPAPAAVAAPAPVMPPAAATAPPLKGSGGLVDLLPASNAPDLCAILSAPSGDAPPPVSTPSGDGPALMADGRLADALAAEGMIGAGAGPAAAALAAPVPATTMPVEPPAVPGIDILATLGPSSGASPLSDLLSSVSPSVPSATLATGDSSDDTTLPFPKR